MHPTKNEEKGKNMENKEQEVERIGICGVILHQPTAGKLARPACYYIRSVSLVTSGIWWASIHIPLFSVQHSTANLRIVTFPSKVRKETFGFVGYGQDAHRSSDLNLHHRENVRKKTFTLYKVRLPSCNLSLLYKNMSIPALRTTNGTISLSLFKVRLKALKWEIY